MQIDFHHAVTYVVGRLAGFDHKDAATIAYAAQYVDDAVNDGYVEFDDERRYHRIATAHRHLQLVGDLDDRKAAELWLPFHFLPGNGGLPAGQDPKGGHGAKLVCTPNSPIAQAMTRACIQYRKKPFGLHRLGVAAHVFADTWAHQGFIGVRNERNDLTEAVNVATGEELDINELPPLGHGQAGHYPDQPFLHWRFTNELGEVIDRNNPEDFTTAADQLCRVFQRYIAGDADLVVTGLSPERKAQIKDMFLKITDEDGGKRHIKWLAAINGGKFGFEMPEKLAYTESGPGSWKYAAVKGGILQDALDNYDWDPGFFASDWKMFHDAAKAHRRLVLDEILPQYGICAA